MTSLSPIGSPPGQDSMLSGLSPFGVCTWYALPFLDHCRPLGAHTGPSPCHSESCSSLPGTPPPTPICPPGVLWSRGWHRTETLGPCLCCGNAGEGSCPHGVAPIAVPMAFPESEGAGTPSWCPGSRALSLDPGAGQGSYEGDRGGGEWSLPFLTLLAPPPFLASFLPLLPHSAGRVLGSWAGQLCPYPSDPAPGTCVTGCWL